MANTHASADSVCPMKMLCAESPEFSFRLPLVTFFKGLPLAGARRLKEKTMECALFPIKAALFAYFVVVSRLFEAMKIGHHQSMVKSSIFADLLFLLTHNAWRLRRGLFTPSGSARQYVSMYLAFLSHKVFVCA